MLVFPLCHKRMIEDSRLVCVCVYVFVCLHVLNLNRTVGHTQKGMETIQVPVELCA